MKKHSLLLMGAGALALAATSCSNDDIPAPAGGDGVTFQVSLPATLATRAYSDGLLATNLKVAIYESGSTQPVISNFPGGANPGSIVITPAGSLKYAVTVPLVKGKSYDVVFWAQSYADDDPANPYTYTPSDKSITVDYSKMVMNTESTDAFYAVAVVPAGASGTQEVTLYRPFAQINVGTDDVADYQKAGDATLTRTALSFSNLADKFNLATSKASGSETDVTYPAAPIPSTSEAFPAGDGMQYIAMAYVLVGDETADKAQINTVGLLLDGATTAFASYDNIPAERNYRTNIYGSLLTDRTEFMVTIDPDFETPDYTLPTVWDGTQSTTPDVDADGNYVVNTAADLAGLFALVNGGSDLSGKTVRLNADIDMNNGSGWTPVGSATTPFKGEFDGAGHTVSGTVKSLFGHVEDADIHDVSVKASTVPYSALTQVTKGTTTLSNVNVTGTVTGSDHAAHLGAAGLVSYVADGSLTIENCVNRAAINDPDYCGGGLVGRTAAPVTIRNSYNYGTVTSTRASEGKAAGIVALPAATLTLDGCANYGDIVVNTSSSAAAGGIVSWSSYGFDMSNCSNSGNVTMTVSDQSAVAVAGGIFGGTGYNNGTQNFSGCSNTGAVKVVCASLKSGVTANYASGIYAGGIAGGVQYGGMSFVNCSDSGAVTAVSPASSGQYQYLAGIAGGLGWLNSLTMTGCTVNASGVLNGNSTVLLRAALYTLCGPDATTLSVSGNTNGTAYPATAK